MNDGYMIRPAVITNSKERRKAMDEKSIIELFFNRDEDAIKEADALYGARLKRVSYGITGDRRDAEECVNDAYLSAWNKIPPESPSNLFAYLCETVRRVSLSKYRYNTSAKRSARTVPIDAELEDVIADTRDDTSGLPEILDEFLSDLPKDTRFLFMRRYYYADDIPTISKMTGLGRNTVSARLMRARKKLAEKLRERGYKI